MQTVYSVVANRRGFLCTSSYSQVFWLKYSFIKFCWHIVGFDSIPQPSTQRLRVRQSNSQSMRVDKMDTKPGEVHPKPLMSWSVEQPTCHILSWIPHPTCTETTIRCRNSPMSARTWAAWFAMDQHLVLDWVWFKFFIQFGHFQIWIF